MSLHDLLLLIFAIGVVIAWAYWPWPIYPCPDPLETAVNLKLADEDVECIIHALDYFANMEAGQTQEPDICVPSDYPEFDLARDIENRLKKSRALRALWGTDPLTGETFRR